MPVFLGIEYADVPDLNPGFTCSLYDYASSTNPFKTASNSAKNTAPLWNAVINALDEYNVGGRVGGMRTDQPDFTLSEIQNAAGLYDVYIHGFVLYAQSMLEYIDTALENPNVPQNNFGAIFHSVYNQNFNTGGSCGYTKNYLEDFTRPWVKLQFDQLKQAKNQFLWVQEAIEAHLEGLIENAEIATIMEEAYARYLARKEENEQAERDLERKDTLYNISQLSLVGAAVLVGASELKIIK